MKKFLSVCLALTASIVTCAEILPPPRTSGGMSLRESLKNRHSVRRFAATPLTMQQLSNILWCANGVNRPNGKRTAPSALDRREIMIYVALPDGGYFYDPEKHALEKICNTDLRPFCGRYTAPCYLIIVPDKTRQPNEVFAGIDAGYVSQNIYLAASAENLGTCAMGLITDRGKLSAELKLGGNTPLLVHPVGTPE